MSMRSHVCNLGSPSFNAPPKPPTPGLHETSAFSARNGGLTMR